jgi:hypothetical protein
MGDAWLCCALVVAGAILRLAGLFRQSLWEDEITSGVYARASIPHLLDLVKQTDNHTPLYYLLVHIVYYKFDVPLLVALRGTSLVFGVATVAIAYLLGRVLMGRVAAFVSAAIVTVSPFTVWYSREARMYALTWCMVLVSYLCLAHAIKSKRPGWLVAYALAVSLALYSDISAITALVPQGAALLGLVALQRVRLLDLPNPRLWLRTLAAHLAGWILIVPWLGALPDQIKVAGGHVVPPTLQLAQTFLLSVMGMSAPYATLQYTVWPVMAALAVVAYASAGMIVLWLARGMRHTLFLLSVATMTLGPLCLCLLFIAVGSTSILFGPRVVGIAAFGIAFLAGGAADQLWQKRIMRTGPTSVGADRGASWRAARSRRAMSACTLCLMGTVLAVTIAGLYTEETRGTNGSYVNRIAAVIQSKAVRADQIIYFPLAGQTAVDAYLPPSSPLQTAGIGSWPASDQAAEQSIASWVKGYRHIWFVYFASGGIHMPVYDAWMLSHGYCRVPVRDPRMSSDSEQPSARLGLIEYAACSSQA